MIQAFIPKDNPALPNTYGITIAYIDGKIESFNIAQHKLTPQMLEFFTADDLINVVVMQNVKRIEFDKNFSKIVSLKGMENTKNNTLKDVSNG